MISIITTAYNNTNFVKEALDSFIESCGEIEYEILVGIDNCEKTLDHIMSFYDNINPNVKIFFFNKKVNTYVIRNTLSTISKFDNLIFFDSDDVMRKHTVSDVVNILNNGYDFFRFRLVPFKGQLTISKTEKLDVKPSYPVGAFGIKKQIFQKHNGFEPWVCAADGEFFWRMQTNNVKIYDSKNVEVLYRRHGDNLTSNPITGMYSSLRKSYHDKKNHKIQNNLNQPLETLTTSTYLGVDKNFYKIYKNSKPKNDHKFDLSIIIPTFNQTSYLEECLRSVLDSIGNLSVEILIGIDSCKTTLDFLNKKIFDTSIKFYFFEKNVGPYIIRNSLAELSNSEYLLFFDSDDIMKPIMINLMFSLQKDCDFVKPMYVNFENGNLTEKEKQTITTNKFGEGVFSIKKDLFLSFNGFEGWRCMADSDFMGRLYNSGKRPTYTKEVCFYRRLHKTSLTQDPKTGYASSLRHKYYNISKSKKNHGPLPTLITQKFYQVDVKTFQKGTDSNNINNLIAKSLEEKIEKENIVKRLELFSKTKDKSTIDYDSINKIRENKGVFVPNKNLKPIRENRPIDRQKIIDIKKESNARQVRFISPGKPNRRNGLPSI